MAVIVEIPDFDFSGFYYPDLLRSLIQFQRANVPEITDENENEPFQQLLRAYALIGHFNNVLLDVVATETLLPTARLLESVRSHLALIDFKLDQARPAQTDIILEFSKTFSVSTNLVPVDSQFSTIETEADQQIIFENDDAVTLNPTTVPVAVFAFTAGKIKVIDNSFDGADQFDIQTVAFRNGIEWLPGASIPLTLTNMVNAINSSANPLILGQVHAINDGIDTISIIPLVSTIESIAITKTDNATNNLEVLSGSFGANKSAVASTDAIFFNMYDDTPKAGDTFNIAHQDIMTDTVEFVFDSVGSGITGVWEFFDGNLEDAKPDLVTNLGSNLELDLTTLLGAVDRSGAIVRVVLSQTGASEEVVSIFSSGKNLIRTKGLLGQTTVDLDEQAYVVGTNWQEVSNVVDGTSSLTTNGKVSFDLPQNLTQNWIKNTINTVNGHWLRFRVIKVTTPTNPSIDRVRIDTGKQFLLIPVVQGQTVVEAPLGSSNGAAAQQLTLTFKPAIEGTIIIEVNEGSGFQPWNSVENFLNSNSVSKDYILEISGDDTATITFGGIDGLGKIPTAGVDNIRAIYRIGADVDGNVGANTISVNKSGISFITRIFNPRQAIGWAAKEGSTDEDLARLKIVGPASLRTLGRAITAPDIEQLATEFEAASGSKIVTRALAIEETFGVKTIELVVVGQSGLVLTESQRNELRDFFNGNEALGIDPVLVTNHEVTVVNYTPKIIPVTAIVTGGNKTQIENAITNLLNPDATFDDGVTKRWSFGQEVPVSVISAEIFEVDPTNIKKVVISIPSGDTALATRELPLVGALNIAVI